MKEQRNRPAGAPGGSGNQVDDLALILPELPLAMADELAAHVAGALVVVVEVEHGRYRRRCYLTAKSAERAVTNARLRGQSARVYLAELKPMYRVPAGGDGDD